MKLVKIGSAEMAKKLKLCPFCGAQAEIVEDHYYKIYCTKCPTTLGAYLTKEEAVKAWNKRVVIK